MKKLLTIGVSSLLLWAAQANAVVMSWTGADGGDGSAIHFNTRTQLFSGVNADSFSWLGTGYFHSHSGSTLSTLELLVDGSWTQVASASTTTVGQTFGNSLSSVYAGVSFGGGLVSGIRFDSNPHNNYSYHNIIGRFELQGTAVPEPAALSLLGLSLLGLVAGTRRRRLCQRNPTA